MSKTYVERLEDLADKLLDSKYSKDGKDTCNIKFKDKFKTDCERAGIQMKSIVSKKLLESGRGAIYEFRKKNFDDQKQEILGALNDQNFLSSIPDTDLQFKDQIVTLPDNQIINMALDELLNNNDKLEACSRIVILFAKTYNLSDEFKKEIYNLYKQILLDEKPKNITYLDIQYGGFILETIIVATITITTVALLYRAFKKGDIQLKNNVKSTVESVKLQPGTIPQVTNSDKPTSSSNNSQEQKNINYINKFNQEDYKNIGRHVDNITYLNKWFNENPQMKEKYSFQFKKFEEMFRSSQRYKPQKQINTPPPPPAPASAPPASAPPASAPPSYDEAIATKTTTTISTPTPTSTSTKQKKSIKKRLGNLFNKIFS
jgi:hypothetical protein